MTHTPKPKQISPYPASHAMDVQGTACCSRKIKAYTSSALCTGGRRYGNQCRTPVACSHTVHATFATKSAVTSDSQSNRQAADKRNPIPPYATYISATMMKSSAGNIGRTANDQTMSRSAEITIKPRPYNPNVIA